MTHDELLARIEDPPAGLEELRRLSAAIESYLLEHPDDVEIAIEAEVVDLLISAHERDGTR